MLLKKLIDYTAGKTYPFHMPGHKRNAMFMPAAFPDVKPSVLPFGLDITEIHCFDDLHKPNGVLLETSKLAASIYGSIDAFMLTCGSTVGILAAIGAHMQRGGKILADANCHRSVKNAARLFGLELAFITPDVDKLSSVPCSIAPQSVEAALRDNPGVNLVVITSPSYEGVVSDIETIAGIAHKANALLLVDCAHGAHLGFSAAFPKSPVKLGADLVVMSLHKTLPALTQCSLLHVCSKLADTKAVKQMLYTLQTSSPSYVLMSSIDYCLRLLETRADELFSAYSSRLDDFYSKVSNLKHLSVLRKLEGFYDFDRGKIVIVTKCSNLSGFELIDILRTKYNMELERATPDYAIAMTSICDPEEAYTRLADALIEIDAK